VPLVALSNARSYRKDLTGALAAAQQAERLEPTWWVAVAAGARAYAAAGKTDDAIQEYRRALVLAPQDALLLSAVALLYHHAQMDAEADKYGDADQGDHRRARQARATAAPGRSRPHPPRFPKHRRRRPLEAVGSGSQRLAVRAHTSRLRRRRSALPGFRL